MRAPLGEQAQLLVGATAVEVVLRADVVEGAAVADEGPLDRDVGDRAALVEVLATMPGEVALDRVRAMIRDEDKRVLPSVLTALAHFKTPDAATIALAQLKEPAKPGFVV